MYKAIGMLEVSSIGKGMYANDLMLKASEVGVVTCGSVCPGKYISIIHGDVAAVENAVKVGIQASAGQYVDSIVIPNVHEGVFSGYYGNYDAGTSGCVGDYRILFAGIYDPCRRYCLKGGGDPGHRTASGDGLGRESIFYVHRKCGSC